MKDEICDVPINESKNTNGIHKNVVNDELKHKD